jgi:hypothetical protein
MESICSSETRAPSELHGVTSYETTLLTITAASTSVPKENLNLSSTEKWVIRKLGIIRENRSDILN